MFLFDIFNEIDIFLTYSLERKFIIDKVFRHRVKLNELSQLIT